MGLPIRAGEPVEPAKATEDELDEVLRRGLDWLQRIAPYDLATVFALDGQRLVVRCARGRLARDNVRGHVIELAAFPTIREALDTRRARTFTEDDHAHGDGDPFDGVLDLPPGHSCMVVPLYAGEATLGVMTLDRTRCEIYPRGVMELVEVYSQVLAMALANAQARQSIGQLQRRDHDRAKLFEQELGGGASSSSVLESSASASMRALAVQARQVAVTDTPILVLGETGTGKERLARALHGWSRRADEPFVTLNCAAIPNGLLESELFGHVRGAFTGAQRDRAGRFWMANGGTLLLDEIGDLPLDLQAKLLRVLQEGTFEPVGSDKSVRVDVRIIAATHVDLERAVAERRFRKDLYYRLAVFPLRLPRLAERLEDLPQLCKTILKELSQRTGRKPARLTREGLAKLARYDWPGNVRELANVLERATILSADGTLPPELLDITDSPMSAPVAVSGRPLPPRVESLDEVQRVHIRNVLSLTGGRIYGPNGAAKLLGLKPSTLQSRMKKLGVPRTSKET